MAKTIVSITCEKATANMNLARSLKARGKSVVEIAEIMSLSKTRIYELLRGINYLPTK